METGGLCWVLGGDLRQLWLARLLAREGRRVVCFGLEQGGAPGCGVTSQENLEGLEQADWVVLPMPTAAREGLLCAPLAQHPQPIAPILERLHPGQALFGGRLDEGGAALAARRGLRIENCLAGEEWATANAVPTAEGTIQLALEQLPITLQDCPVLILGYGRIGRALAPRLKALGSRVTVFARREESRTQAQALGCAVMGPGLSLTDLSGFALVVNTIPAPILGQGELAALAPSCLTLDLASAPGGVDREAAQHLGRKVVWALALPGKTAPASAAAILRRAMEQSLSWGHIGKEDAL